MEVAEPVPSSEERLNALAELKYEVSRLSRQLQSLRALVDGPTLRAFLDPRSGDGMVAGESPSTGTVAPHETPTAAGLGCEGSDQ